ncbi:YdcF family protein, partial [Ruminococcaceae bacterium OttesenSCG-928-D13]|nr:YdcF family protein [Ruminococcaceae bacterium OttesenSCG-928-D13]
YHVCGAMAKRGTAQPIVKRLHQTVRLDRIEGMLKMTIVWALAALFTANSLLATIRSSFNMGHLVLWLCSVCLILYGIFHKQIDAFCQAGLGRVLKWIFFAGVTVYAGLFIFVAVSGYADQAQGDEKAIVVLGAGLRGERVSDVLRRRLDAALEAWEQNPGAVVVVTGGQGPGENIPEAAAMKKWLVERGVPKEAIIAEDKSVSTEENLLFAQQLLAEAGITPDAPVAVVTNAFHCYRAGQYAKKLGFTDVNTVPASMNVTAILPSYLREVLAILYLWVFKGNLS